MLQASIRRGELDRQITFIANTPTRGTSNEDVPNWAELATNVFARVKNYAGKELVVKDQLTFIQQTEFIIIYRTDINETNRIVFGGRVYEITSILETDQRGMYTRIIGNYLDNETWP